MSNLVDSRSMGKIIVMTPHPPNSIRVGMIGLGMIFEETYLPMFDRLAECPLYHPDYGIVGVEMASVASRTGQRAERFRSTPSGRNRSARSFSGESGLTDLLASGIDAVCVATPDDRHFEAASAAIRAGKHVLIEKPSVLTLDRLDTLCELAEANRVLAKVVYHKLADPDHKKLRTLVLENTLRHVNNGYCSLLEPKSISTSQFAEWIAGRNPGTYVAVHYLKLIDFTFGHRMELARIGATGQRGIVSSPVGNTWDSVQLQVTYRYPDMREATFDIHTDWVTPDNFSGYVDQEVQFRFDNAIWLAHQRKRGVELAIEGRTPDDMKNTPNHHYNGKFVEPWNEPVQRGYGIEILTRFFEEVAYVEYGPSESSRDERLSRMRQLDYNDLSADRNCVAIVQAMEAILARHADGEPGCRVLINSEDGGSVLQSPTGAKTVLYAKRV